MKTRESLLTYVDRPGHWHHLAPGTCTCTCGATFCTGCGIRTACHVGWDQPAYCIHCGGPDQPMTRRDAQAIACHQEQW